MRFFTVSRLYAASIIGLSVIALAVACDQTTDTPPDTLDMTMTSPPDLTPVIDMTSFNAPTVTSVTPVSGANNAPTPIVITGTDFRAGATVTVGGVACTNVVVASAATINCTVPAKAATCGPQDIVVTHPDDQKAGTGTKLFSYRSTGAASWAAPVNYATGTGPRRVIAADINADGKIDLITVNQTGNNITVKTGLGDGTFPNGASQNLSVGVTPTGPSDLAMGDFNADGKPDIVTINANGSITVFTNQGATAFTSAIFNTTGFIAGPNAAIAVGDVTADSKLDVLVASPASISVLPLIGAGNGTFTVGTGRPVGGFVGDLALADMNKDGKLDIVTANTTTLNVTVCLSTGVGTFGNPINQNAGTNPSGLFVTDLNGDKAMDVVVANTTSMNVSVLIGDGAGNLGLAQNQPLATNKPESVWVADVTGDKLPDLLTANAGSNNWSLLQGMTPTVYATQVATNTGAGPTDITVSDLNGDGLQDIIVASNGSSNVQVSLGICK